MARDTVMFSAWSIPNPQIITKELLNDLDSLRSFDMDHLPDEIKLIEIFLKRYPDIASGGLFWHSISQFNASVWLNC